MTDLIASGGSRLRFLLRSDKMDVDMMEQRHDPGKDEADIKVDASGDDHRGAEQEKRC